MRERVARPRRSSALSCVFVVALALALAGSACALSVDIVLPEANPAEVAQYEEMRFEAVCRDSRGNDVTEKASFLWTFTETERPAAGNPVSHRFRDAGKFTVTVSQTEYPYDPKYATRGCVPTREEALFALETSAVFAFYGHANAEVAVLDGVHNEGLRIEDVKAADLGNLFLIIWGGCKTALGCDNLTTASVSTTTGPPRAAAAVGFEESVITYSLPIFSESFWEQFAGLPQANVDDATYEACWDAWVLTGDEGILSYQVEGDYAVTLAPTRWNGGDE